MKKKNSKKPVFIDGTLLIHGHMSGVGRVAKYTIDCLLQNNEFTQKYQLVTFVPLGLKRRLVATYPDLAASSRVLPLPRKALEFLSRSHLLPPIDLYLGEGVYVFFNFRNLTLIRSKSITYIHDVSFLDMPEFAHPANVKYLSKHIGSWARRSTRVATISSFSRDRINATLRIPKDKMDVIYCGYDKESRGPFAREHTKEVLSRYELPGQYLLCVGNIEPRKNIGNLLEAYLEASRRGVKTPLVLIGADGWNNKEIHETLSGFTGGDVITPRSNVTDGDLAIIMSGAKGLITPSRYEGFSLPPLEAYVRGTPIAISNIPVHEELYEGEALFFDPLDIGSIAGALIDLDSGKGIKPKRKGRLAEFTWGRAAAKLYNIIESLEK